MDKQTLLILVLIGLGLWPRLEQLKDKVSPLLNLVSFSQKIEVVKPNNDKVVTAVQPITAYRGQISNSDKILMVAFYQKFSEVIVSNKDLIKTTGHLRIANQNASLLMFTSTQMKGKYSGLTAAMEKATKDVLGDDNAKLDNALAAELFNGIAWAIGG